MQTPLGTRPNTGMSSMGSIPVTRAPDSARPYGQKYMAPFTQESSTEKKATFELEDIPDHLRVRKTFNVSQFKQCKIHEHTASEHCHWRSESRKSKASEYEIEYISVWEYQQFGKCSFWFNGKITLGERAPGRTSTTSHVLMERTS